MQPGTCYRSDILRILAANGGVLCPVETEADKIAEAKRLEIVARLCGFDYKPPDETHEVVGDHDSTSTPLSQSAPAAPPTEKPQPTGFAFWYAKSLQVLPGEVVQQRMTIPEIVQQAKPFVSGDLRYDTNQRLRGKPLLHWSKLWPFLREVLGHHKLSRQPDLPHAVRLLARARPVQRLPRKVRRAWHPRVFLVLDRRLELTPFRDDYEHVEKRLESVRGKTGLHVLDAEMTHPAPCILCASDATRQDWRQRILHTPDAAVLVLGDLHQYQGGTTEAEWLTFGKRLRQRGIVPWALCPCPRERWSAPMAHVWNLSAWDRGLHLSPQPSGQHVAAPPDGLETIQRKQREDLLALLAPAIRIERGLFRDLRFLLPHDQADAGTEYDLFNQLGGISHGFQLPIEKARELRKSLHRLPTELLVEAVRTLRRHHVYTASVFAHMELLALHSVLPPHQWQALVDEGVVSTHDPDDLQLAREFWARMVKTAHERPNREREHFFRPDLERLEGEAQNDPLMQAAWALAHRDSDEELADWVQPQNVAWTTGVPGEEIKHPIFFQEGIALGMCPARARFQLGSLRTRSRTCFVTLLRAKEHPKPKTTLELPFGQLCGLPPERLEDAVSLRLESDRETLEISTMPRPAWAKRMGYDRSGLWAESGPPASPTLLRWLAPERGADTRGGEWVRPLGMFIPGAMPAWAEKTWQDQYGLAAEFHIREVPFVLRWIPPGRFLMGSPEDEPGRWEPEGPQHEVTISQGYWLAETPVTQAQWRVVVQAAREDKLLRDRLKLFSKDLQPAPSHFKGPDSLPVESVNWHQSRDFCRLLDELLPEGPGFHLPSEAQWEYACRAETQSAFNDGSACTLPEGNDPALDKLGWFNENSGSQTHPVKEKQTPNAWGLHDMHGNVWEWCADAWHDYTAEPQTNPRVDLADKSANRVMRGGSWDNHARLCRSAYRGRDDPGDDWPYLGLRLAAGQNEPRAAEPPVPERRSRARRAGGTGPA